jgi:hypothetical protein
MPLAVIAGLDPVIPSDSGGCGGARIKSGHDGEGVFLCPWLILMPTGHGLASCAGRGLP